MQLVFFWVLKEVCIQFIKYVEKSDSTECDREFVMNKKSNFTVLDTTIGRYVRQNNEDLLTTDYCIKLDVAKLHLYQDEYLKNCINDDIADDRILLYSFEKQLDEVRKDMLHKRQSFWKRKFEINTGNSILHDSPNINLFTILYYLEFKWWIRIENSAGKALYFDGKIPELFIISITAQGMEYLDEFDYMKKLSKMTYNTGKTDKNSPQKNIIYFDEKTKELSIDWYKKKLLQKQIIFIEALFDLKDKSKEWWVSLEEIAIYDDHAFEDNSEAGQEKIIKNFYNIGNHMNKSIKLATEFEKVLEITTKEVRINPKFTS